VKARTVRRRATAVPAASSVPRRNQSSAAGRHEGPARPAVVRQREPAHDRDRHALGLALDELGGRGELVRHGDLGDLEHRAVAVGRPAGVADGGEPGHADGEVDLPDPPRTARGVGHDDGDAPTGQRAEPLPQAAGARVGVQRQQGDLVAPDVAGVDARGRQHQAVAVLGDDRRPAAGDHPDRLVGDRGAPDLLAVGPRRDGTSRPSALLTTLLVTTTTSPSSSGCPCAVRAWGPSPRGRRRAGPRAGR
jgi:hypothetical protein